MITFNVVKERHGWAIRMGEQMAVPFWSRDLAISEAHALAAAIRRHGQSARVIVEEYVPGGPPTPISEPIAPRSPGAPQPTWAAPA